MLKRIVKFIRKSFLKTPGRNLILTGVVLILLGTSLKFVHSWMTNVPVTKPQNSVFAKNISIPNAKINAPITLGGFIDGRWILSEKSVLMLPQDKESQNNFSLILYAHNRPGLFANLKKVTIGDRVFIENEKNERLVYEVYSKETVKTRQVDKVQSSNPNTLILFTCNGLFDQSRLLVKAKKFPVFNKSQSSLWQGHNSPYGGWIISSSIGKVYYPRPN